MKDFMTPLYAIYLAAAALVNLPAEAAVISLIHAPEPPCALVLTTDGDPEDSAIAAAEYFKREHALVTTQLQEIRSHLEGRSEGEGKALHLEFMGQVLPAQFTEFEAPSLQLETINPRQCVIYRFALSSTGLSDHRRVYSDPHYLFAIYDQPNKRFELVQGCRLPIFQ